MEELSGAKEEPQGCKNAICFCSEGRDVVAECSAVSSDKYGAIRLSDEPTEAAFPLVDATIRGDEEWSQCMFEEIVPFGVDL